MNSWWLRLGLLVALGVPGRAFAQQVRPWPHQPTTGRIAFAGLLLWPTPLLTLGQKQALVRRWYLANLTTGKQVPLARNAPSETTFAGLPNWTYLDSVSYLPGPSRLVDSVYDMVTWRLAYDVDLVATPVGLAYRLSELKCGEMVFDSGYDWPLETVPPRLLAQQASFYRRLRKALAGW
jgi:hypothetical protein